MAGVAVCRCIREVSDLDARIKWPNDVLVNGRKVAGVLTEMEAWGGRIHHLVVGIGINVNTPLDKLTEALQDKAGSLAQEAGRPFSRARVLGALLWEMEQLWEALRAEGFESIRGAWRSLSDTLGVRVRVEGKGTAVLGRAEDLDEDGSLLVRGDDGAMHRVSHGEVTVVPV
jgi:BirA family biotin operon repressor/biotin-[acetyl-CoA-carboxylase] ligase